MEIAGKTFIVTGGASGLGEASVRRLVEVASQALINANRVRPPARCTVTYPSKSTPRQQWILRWTLLGPCMA